MLCRIFVTANRSVTLEAARLIGYEYAFNSWTVVGADSLSLTVAAVQWYGITLLLRNGARAPTGAARG